MRLRTFLIKRAVHTMITLIIVLVLLFVIFRLMPGDPTRFFIRPGQTEADREALLVEFGFYKYVPAPFHGYTAQFPSDEAGTYEISTSVTDSLLRSAPFWWTHVRETASPTAPRIQVTADDAAGDPAWDIHPGDDVTISLDTFNVPPYEAFNSTTVTISTGGTSVFQQDIGTNRSVSWPAGVEGAYSVVVAATGNVSGMLTSYAGVAVNRLDTTPFQLVEWNLTSAPVSSLGERTQVTVNVTSAGAAITRVAGSVRPPGGGLPLDLTLTHPRIAIPTNILEEFWAYMTSMLQGDFGTSLYTRRPVWDEISLRVGPSLLLFGSATIISYLLGVIIGAVLAWRRGSKLELSSIVVSLFFYSMPVFWFGLILLWAFAFTWEVFPLGGYADIEAVEAGGVTYIGNVLWHMALPLLNLVILSLAGTILLMRNSMLEVMGEDYITTAKAKGISERRIMYHHAARNAMLPVVTAFALSISGVISGGVLTETIFSWPGMGAFLVTATIQQDFPSVQGAFYLLALLTIFANLIADVLYAYLDPRVRL
jgi:peptide/nickel transport system permease protein